MDSRTDKNKHNKSESIDDVHQKLFQWFEKRGLLLELRAHMRQQMVRALQENVTGLNSCRKKFSSSPKFQAMHMIIADFLLQQEHHYTVSVFSTEVPILNSLPEFSEYVANILNSSNDGMLPVTTSAPRFSSIDIQDILETLGLPPHTQAGAYASELYEESGEALLTCIVRALSAQHGMGTSRHNLPTVNNQLSINYSPVRNESNDSDEEALEYSDQDAEHWTSKMREILLQSDVKIRHINKLQEKMKKFYDNEIHRVQQEEASKYEAMCAQQEANMEHRLREEISREFAEQESELEIQKKDLHSLALQLHAEHTEVTSRLSELQIQSDMVEDQKKQQENESALIKKLKIEIDLQQEQIEESFTRLSIDQENLKRKQDLLKSCPTKSNTIPEEKDKEEFQKMIQKISEQLEDAKEKLANRDNVLVLRQPLITNSTQTELHDHVDREQQTLCVSQPPDPELVHQLQLERETISQLQEESIELRAYVLQQRCRIDELTHRATTLSTQLEEAQQSIAQHNCQDRMMAVPAAPILPPRSHPPLIHPTHSYLNWQPQRTGAGEESLFTPRHVPQQPSNRHEARRRPMTFNFSQNISPTSEDSSPTDEILQEARIRLHDLEEQSAAVNRSYREFQARQLEESNTVVINRNIPNSHAHRITNYFSSAPVPSQVPVQRTHPFNHPRLHTQIPISDESDDGDDDLYINNSRRPSALFSRRRNVTNRLFIPSDNPLLSRRLYFTNFKHFPKYVNFKKKHGKSPLTRATTIENRQVEGSGSNTEHLSNQSEHLHKNSKRTENQACQTNLNFFNERRERGLDYSSSSDSDSSFDRNETVKYKAKTSKIISKQLQHYKKVKLRSAENNFERDVKNFTENPKECVKKDTGENQEPPKKTDANKFETPLPKIVMNPLSSAISSSSLAVESIPKDDSTTAITSLQETNVEQIDYSNTLESRINKSIETEEVEYVHNTPVAAESIPALLEEPLPLTVPNLSLLNEETTTHETQTNILRGLEHQGEENVDVPASAEALSVTSGSDIFRELEISLSEHSDIISAPLDDYSKHSSDFWE